jgi:uncharacterized integral membrane protein
MGILKGIIFILILAASIGFAVHNDQGVSLRYYFGAESLPLPLFIWVFLFFSVGLILSGIAALFSRIAMQAKIRHLKKSIVDLEKKRNELKSTRIANNLS